METSILLGKSVRVGAFIAMLPLAGCYTWVAASPDSLIPGTQARVRLTQDGFGRVVNQSAANGVPVERLDFTNRGVIGRVVEFGSDELMIELHGAGSAVFAAAVPRRAIEGVALREFRPARTAAIVAASVLIGGTVLGGTVGGGGSGDVDDVLNLVMPWFSIRFW